MRADREPVGQSVEPAAPILQYAADPQRRNEADDRGSQHPQWRRPQGGINNPQSERDRRSQKQ
jgi:hypothetical protein